MHGCTLHCNRRHLVAENISCCVLMNLNSNFFECLDWVKYQFKASQVVATEFSRVILMLPNLLIRVSAWLAFYDIPWCRLDGGVDASVDHIWPYAVGLNAGLVNTVLLHSLGHRNYSNCPFAQWCDGGSLWAQWTNNWGDFYRSRWHFYCQFCQHRCQIELAWRGSSLRSVCDLWCGFLLLSGRLWSTI